MKNRFLYPLLEKTSKPLWLTVLLAIYVFFQFAFNGLFGVNMTHLKELAGGVTMPDLHFYYTRDFLQNLFNSYGESGIKEYMQLQLVDMIYPVAYALLLSSLLFIPYKNTKTYYLIYFPFIAIVFDYFENFAIRYLATAYPDMSNGVVHFAAFCTSWKWIFIAISILSIFYGFGLMIYRKYGKNMP